VDVGQHTSAGDGHSAQQLVELLVVANRQLDVAGGDARALVVAGGVAGKLEDLGGGVLLTDGEWEGQGGQSKGHCERLAWAKEKDSDWRLR